MDLAVAVYALIFLLSIAFLYDQSTKRIPNRLDPYQAPKSRFELVAVGANGLPTRADGIERSIVFATRRAEAANTSEEAAPDTERFVNWISDFLPEDLPPAIYKNVRMFFYNYDSYWKREAVHTRLAHHGNELLEHINGEIRASEAERSRNLVFVAYSYGGLVVKQALVQAQANRDLGHVAEHTKAILFLGTPYRGSNFGVWGWWAALALQPLGSNLFILANLEYDSTSLLDLYRAFVGNARDDLRVFNFFEKRPIQMFRLWLIRWEQFCVREQSATYEGPKVRNIGLPVDHYGLNKFGWRSESYQVIRSKLVETVDSFARLGKRHYAVPFETAYTYTERTALSMELEEKMRIRHEKASIPFAVVLHGLGGAGKSQLALDYAERYKDRYNPILWIDATDEEAVRSSFRRCATELGLPDERVEKQGPVLTDTRVLAALRWLRDRTEVDDEWLVIVNNADDVSWGIQKILPKGKRGSILITSQDQQSVQMLSGACGQVQVGAMSRVEGAALLLRHLGLDVGSASEGIRRGCEEVAHNLGYLALAIELAGAYIGSDPAPGQALTQYLEDYKRHRDELLKMDHFRGLLPTEKTVWTVWDTTLDKITKKYSNLKPDVLLTFLAHFKGSIVQDELFRLASLGMAAVDAELDDAASEGIPADLRQYVPVDDRDEWDSFRYRQSRDVLVRYSLLLVQWRATRNDPIGQWRRWYMVFILAVCCQMIEEQDRPEFRRHLIAHLPDISEDDVDGDKILTRHHGFIGTEEAEKLQVQVMEIRKTKLGADHFSTLTSIANLAATYRNQGR
ncbi:hypothetical protein C8A01DRAFT_50136 [Parachaetomium inaequale]|uniref:NB-ARC domain-containing protein n=1 Tax=Parachaetomium inaequale TaxID=2588326 RepID=A0AAN6P7L9_9PEZI|nr:hypothetical protein C8A01DRAFT_50136 [Parachaetomium inaequale]